MYNVFNMSTYPVSQDTSEWHPLLFFKKEVKRLYAFCPKCCQYYVHGCECITTLNHSKHWKNIRVMPTLYAVTYKWYGAKIDSQNIIALLSPKKISNKNFSCNLWIFIHIRFFFAWIMFFENDGFFKCECVQYSELIKPLIKKWST